MKTPIQIIVITIFINVSINIITYTKFNIDFRKIIENTLVRNNEILEDNNNVNVCYIKYMEYLECIHDNNNNNNAFNGNEHNENAMKKNKNENSITDNNQLIINKNNKNENIKNDVIVTRHEKITYGNGRHKNRRYLSSEIKFQNHPIANSKDDYNNENKDSINTNIDKNTHIKNATTVVSSGYNKYNQNNNYIFMKNNLRSIISREHSLPPSIATPPANATPFNIKRPYPSTTEKRRLEMIWGILGAPINGVASLDHLGASVSISGDGKIVATGAINNDDNGPSSGHVKILTYSDDTNTWDQLGSVIIGAAAYDFFGQSVSLSDDGTTVAVGAPKNDDNGSTSGHVKIYRYFIQTDTWNQLGDAIVGVARGDEFGH